MCFYHYLIVKKQIYIFKLLNKLWNIKQIHNLSTGSYNYIDLKKNVNPLQIYI